MTYQIYLKGEPVSPAPDFRGTKLECNAMLWQLEREDRRHKGNLEVREVQ